MAYTGFELSAAASTRALDDLRSGWTLVYCCGAAGTRWHTSDGGGVFGNDAPAGGRPGEAEQRGRQVALLLDGVHVYQVARHLPHRAVRRVALRALRRLPLADAIEVTDGQTG